jgi:hypothetical protein
MIGEETNIPVNREANLMPTFERLYVIVIKEIFIDERPKIYEKKWRNAKNWFDCLPGCRSGHTQVGQIKHEF